MLRERIIVMILDHIKNVTCPTCGAGMESEGRGQQHTNGHWNERREFSCGLKLHFSPNFMQVELDSPGGRFVPEEERFASMCKKDPRRIEHTKKTDDAKERLRNYIRNMKGVSKDWKERHIEAIRFT